MREENEGKEGAGARWLREEKHCKIRIKEICRGMNAAVSGGLRHNGVTYGKVERGKCRSEKGGRNEGEEG